MNKNTTAPDADVVVIPFKIKEFLWGDWKKLRRLKDNPKFLTDEMDWFIGFVDRVCDGQADNVPMLDLLALLMDAMNREMAKGQTDTDPKV